MYSGLFTNKEFEDWSINLFSQLSIAKTVEFMEVLEVIEADTDTPEAFLDIMVSCLEMEKEEWPLAVIDPKELRMERRDAV